MRRNYSLPDLPDDFEMINNKLPDWLEERVNELAKELIGGADYFGSCYLFWAAKKKILRDRYGIEWMSPADEYPDMRFD